MINSRKLSDLRDDVRANVEVLISECSKQGLKVLVTQTLRDNEYQATLYAQGRTKAGSIVTNSPVTTYHGAGLAFDICQNIKGQEYSDLDFFKNVATIAKKIGFSWGGDWKSFVDRPHFQWDEKGNYRWNSKTKPKAMPLYGGEEVTQAEFDKMMQNWLDRQNAKEVSKASSLYPEYQEAIKAGITDGSKPYGFSTRVQAAVMCLRANKK